MKASPNNILWGLVALYAATIVTSLVAPNALPIAVPVLLLLAFVLLHGALRYRLSGILLFIVIALVVSNILENTSILTGFPFGHYHYTDALGPKLFLVPVLIGPAYIGTGYLSWVLATVLVGEVRRESSALTTFGVPLIASFMMVVWDLCFDPSFSTIAHRWIWEQGGGYFGVPLTNYLGWFLTVYLFYQLFALSLRWRAAGSEDSTTASRAYAFQAVALYAVQGLTFILQYLLAGRDRLVTDAVGRVWHTGDIVETAAIISIFTMLFAAILTAVKLLQSPSAAPEERRGVEAWMAGGRERRS
ncbi:MAG TPA: carotenoid biosynthesis protein [Ktedonobacterales bacterium]